MKMFIILYFFIRIFSMLDGMKIYNHHHYMNELLAVKNGVG